MLYIPTFTPMALPGHACCSERLLAHMTMFASQDDTAGHIPAVHPSWTEPLSASLPSDSGGEDLCRRDGNVQHPTTQGRFAGAPSSFRYELQCLLTQ